MSRRRLSTRTLRFGALGAVAAAGLLLSACFTANLSGGGTRASVISSAIGSKIELRISSRDSLGTGIGSATGNLKDTGKNLAFPKGVSLSFRRASVYGFGDECTHDGGPSRAVHVAAVMRGGLSDPCMMWPDPRTWVGLVTYSSADRSYPNTVNPECAAGYLEYLHSFGAPFTAPISKPTASQIRNAPMDADYVAMSGFGIMVIVDTNLNGNPDKGDGFSFTTVCGPYTNLPTGIGMPVSMNCAAAGMVCKQVDGGYNYATCPAETFSAPQGGMVPTDWAWAGWGPVLDVLTDPESGCLQAMRTGDLRIGIAVDLTNGTVAPKP